MRNSLIFTLFYLSEFNIYGKRRFTTREADNVFEKYILAVKKLSADFPNHQIELHLDIAEAEAPKTQRRFNYIHLRKAEQLTDSDGINVTQSSSLPTVTTADPDMRPLYMKDLKAAVEELENKYSRHIERSLPKSLSVNIDPPTETKPDATIKYIQQLLEKGEVVNNDLQKPPEENLSWLKIKIPK